MSPRKVVRRGSGLPCAPGQGGAMDSEHMRPSLDEGWRAGLHLAPADTPLSPEGVVNTVAFEIA